MITQIQGKDVLAKKIAEATAKVGVIGLGYVGLPTAFYKAQKGFDVVGFDVSEEKVEKINRGINYIDDVDDEALRILVQEGKLKATDEFVEMGDMDVVLMCVPTPIDKYKNPDLSFVASAIEKAAPYMKKETLVLFESTTYPGTTEEIIVPVLEEQGFTVGEDVFVAYSPERVDPGNKNYGLHNTPKVVGGVTEECTALAAQFIGETAHPVSDVKVAEMSKVYENTFRYINMALANETAMICHEMGIDMWEVVDASKTKPYGFMPFYPGVGVGGHCIPVDPYYLTYKAKEYGKRTEMIELSGKINDSMKNFVFNRLVNLLNEQGKSLKESKVTVLGVAYKENIEDMRESPVIPFLEEIMGKTGEIHVVDPHVESFKAQGVTLYTTPYSDELIEESDIVVLTTAHAAFPYHAIADKARVVLDTKNAFSRYEIASNHIITL